MLSNKTLIKSKVIWDKRDRKKILLSKKKYFFYITKKISIPQNITTHINTVLMSFFINPLILKLMCINPNFYNKSTLIILSYLKTNIIISNIIKRDNTKNLNSTYVFNKDEKLNTNIIKFL